MLSGCRFLNIAGVDIAYHRILKNIYTFDRIIYDFIYISNLISHSYFEFHLSPSSALSLNPAPY